MLSMRHLRGLGLASALVLGGAAAAQAGTTTQKMPTTLDPVPGNASATELQADLREQGFVNVQDVAHSGDIYTTKAQWQGRWVDLRIDAKTGGITYENIGNPVINADKATTDAMLRQELSRIGFDNVDGIERSGNVITARGYHYGQQVDLRVDTRTGVVTTAQDLTDSAIPLPKEGLNAAALRDQLASLGYTDVRDVREQGEVYTLSAYKNGQWVDLRIDADNGAVTVIR